jgi:nickel-dependent lactate racemase
LRIGPPVGGLFLIYIDGTMTKIILPFFDAALECDIPGQNLAGIFSPGLLPPVPDLDKAIEEALSRPIGISPIPELIRPGQRVLIISDDNTRNTPVHKILPPLVARLEQAGVRERDITVLMALGTHRYMSREEMIAKVGEAMFSRLRVVNHIWMDRGALISFGRTSRGTPLAANRLLSEHEVKIGLGAIVPHHIPGFSGGAKIIQPGVCGPETTAETHLLSCQGGGDSFLGQTENPVRADLEEMAEKVGLTAIVNAVLDPSGQTLGIFFGGFREAFRKGVELCRKVYGVPYRERPDIVISNSHPCHLDFWQAHKSLYPAQMMVKPGGLIILCTPCPEGISPVHRDLLQFARLSSAEIMGRYRNGAIKNGVAAALATAWAMAREKAPVITYSTGLSPEEIDALGHKRAPSLAWAIEEALRIKGPGARISVLTHAPDTLPIFLPT